MPALTLAALISETTAALGNRLDLTTSQVSLHANLAQLEIASMLPHTELLAESTLTIAASGTSVSLPADYGEAVDVFRPNSYDAQSYRLLTQVPIREIDNASEGTTAGTANRYAVAGSKLHVYPYPTSLDTFVLRYVKVPSDMTNLTDRPSLHTRYHPAILYKTMENVADRVVDNQRAAYYRNKVISVLGATPTPGAALQRSER